MLNKNLFILLLSFVVIFKSFSAQDSVDKTKSEPKEVSVEQDVVKDSVSELPQKDVAKETEKKPEIKSQEVSKKVISSEALKEKPVEKKEAKKEKQKAKKVEKNPENKSELKPESASKEEPKEKTSEKPKEIEKKEIEKKKPEVFLIDKIDTVIYGPEETSIITQSDLSKIGLDGQKRTKDKMIFELQVFQDAKKYNIMDEKLVDKYIEAIQAQQNLSLDEIKKMFYDFGYTYEEGREQLAMYNTINQLMDYKVRSKVIIPEREVREYYDAHPEHLEEAYNLQRIFIPVEADTDLDDERKNIESKIKSGEVISGADYSENFWVEKPELAADKLFISSMLPQAYSDPVLVEGGFEIFKLVERRERQLASFDQRYREITDKLREPLYNKLFDEYKESLNKDSVIIEL